LRRGLLAGSLPLGHDLEEMDLTFHKQRLRKQGQFLVAEYIRMSAEAVETVCKLAVDVNALPEDRRLDTAGFLESVTLTRATLKNSSFPEIVSASLDLAMLEFEHDGVVDGVFHVQFDNHDTLNGTFYGNLVEIEILP
jgi:hypothetical protein